jgi:hypothetical protein
MRCRLDRPAVPTRHAPRVDGAWVVDLHLDDAQADGLASIRCGKRGGSMVPVGWAERPGDVLDRLRVSPGSGDCQVFARVECADEG